MEGRERNLKGELYRELTIVRTYYTQVDNEIKKLEKQREEMKNKMEILELKILNCDIS
jgi:hypothetical protein